MNIVAVLCINETTGPIYIYRIIRPCLKPLELASS
jgi:hypothetical protein